jgi:hypothetical protein
MVHNGSTAPKTEGPEQDAALEAVGLPHEGPEHEVFRTFVRADVRPGRGLAVSDRERTGDVCPTDVCGQGRIGVEQ